MHINKYIKVHLKTRKVKGHTYYYLYWQGPDGKPVRRSMGNSRYISKRQANAFRGKAEADVNSRRNSEITLGQAPRLSIWAETYMQIRKADLAPGTIELYQQTISYLLEYFSNDPPMDRITATQAGLFKAALAEGALSHITKRKAMLSEATIDMHMRNSRAIFNKAIEGDLIINNPFKNMPRNIKAAKGWYYVTPKDFQAMLNASPSISWRLLLSLCRKAALRRGEAINLEWADIDFEQKIITVIAKEDWQPKDKEPRKIPIEQDLYNLLLEAYEAAQVGQKKVVNSIPSNLSRDLRELCRRAGVQEYSKPFHTLRKNCITDWASRFPVHVVKEWAGHANMETTNKHYLQVSESEYKKASNVRLFEISSCDPAQLSAQPAKNGDFNNSKNLDNSSKEKDLKEIAGDQNRTGVSSLGSWCSTTELRPLKLCVSPLFTTLYTNNELLSSIDLSLKFPTNYRSKRNLLMVQGESGRISGVVWRILRY